MFRRYKDITPKTNTIDLVFAQGKFIAQLEEGGTRFALYALYRFLVEIEYDIARNKIVRKRSFISGKLLDKYSETGENFNGLL